ncbi:hypothetical protein V8D89_001242 [Ganoderma adspersum]
MSWLLVSCSRCLLSVPYLILISPVSVAILYHRLRPEVPIISLLYHSCPVVPIACVPAVPTPFQASQLFPMLLRTIVNSGL